MQDSEPTSWRLILGAGQGDRSLQRRFVSRYQDLITRCLRRRWQSGRLADQVDDASQEVFVECFGGKGVLARMQDRRPVRFRAYLIGVILNVARAFEKRRRRTSDDVEMAADDASIAADGDADLLSWFEREWAHTVIREALRRLADREPAAIGERSAARLLELRFQEGMPIRDIAARWQVAPERVHRDYARARREFHACLQAIVQTHESLSATELEEECRELTMLLG